MKFLLCIIGLLISIAGLFGSQGCNPYPTSIIEEPGPDSTGGGAIALKPNIYLYPEHQRVLTVRLEFPLGGTMLESIPACNGGWTVQVEPSGRIDGSYDYLFYECQTPDRYQLNAGWTISRDSLPGFFTRNLTETGFNEREIRDFVEYWIPVLVDHPRYLIYPQYSKELGKVIKLHVTGRPDNIIRLFYVIEGAADNQRELPVPQIPPFSRSGFDVAEWGVVLR